MTKPTARPWFRDRRQDPDDASAEILGAGGTFKVADIEFGDDSAAEDRANVTHILVCVNSHENLLDTLRAMQRCPGIGQTDQESGETFDTMLAWAIARGEGRA